MGIKLQIHEQFFFTNIPLWLGKRWVDFWYFNTTRTYDICQLSIHYFLPNQGPEEPSNHACLHYFYYKMSCGLIFHIEIMQNLQESWHFSLQTELLRSKKYHPKKEFRSETPLLILTRSQNFLSGITILWNTQYKKLDLNDIWISVSSSRNWWFCEQRNRYILKRNTCKWICRPWIP